MDAGLLAQYVMNGLMLGMMYALVAVGFTLFFGVLDVIKFSHGDVLTVGAFTALATFVALQTAGLSSQLLDSRHMLAAGVTVVVGLQLMLPKTKLGRAIGVVAQDEETARTMVVNFTAVVLTTFGIGSALAAFAGLMNRLYYNEINFGM